MPAGYAQHLVQSDLSAPVLPMLPRPIGALVMITALLGGCAALDEAASPGMHTPASGSPRSADSQLFVSTRLGEVVSIRISAPAEDSDGPWPVVYVLDGDHLFGLVTDTIQLLNASSELPPCVVVAVDGTDTGDTGTAALTAASRTHHFTPAASTASIEATGLQAASAGPDGGGADAFLAFLTDELSLFVAAQYPIDASRRVLVGDGLGGLFVVHAFLSSNAFTHFLAVSPALWWGDQIALREEAALAAHSDDRAASLFLAAGAQESDAADLDLVKNVELLSSRLESRAYPNLHSATVIFAGENAGSVTPAAISRGLRFLLQTR